MSIISKEVTNGLLVYFSKKNNVKNWVIHDINISPGSSSNNFSVNESGNVYVAGNILANGTNLSRLILTSSIPDEDYSPSASSLVNGYFTSSNLSDDRLFIVPSAADIISVIPNCSVNTCFRFTINNVQSGDFNRTLTTVNPSVTIDSSCLNTLLVRNLIFSYIVLITNITPESESAVILQDSSAELF